MIILIIKRLGFVLASVLFGIMIFLSFARLDSCLKTALINKYDNYFILFVSTFLIGYIIELSTRLKDPQSEVHHLKIKAWYLKTYKLLIVSVCLYALTDWTENYLQLLQCKKPTVEVLSWLKILGIVKWCFPIIAFVSGTVVDLKSLRNGNAILWGFIYSGIYMLGCMLILGAITCLKSLC